LEIFSFGEGLLLLRRKAGDKGALVLLLRLLRLAESGVRQVLIGLENLARRPRLSYDCILSAAALRHFRRPFSQPKSVEIAKKRPYVTMVVITWGKI
jgi:hypothetical protein